MFLAIIDQSMFSIAHATKESRNRKRLHFRTVAFFVMIWISVFMFLVFNG